MRLRQLIPLAAMLGLALAACSKTEASSSDPSASDKAAAADNTKKNERDQNPGALTPMDQGGSEADRNITAEIRQNVVKEDSLSMTAKNVKIITQGGTVTLRGPVKSAEERATIERLAQRAAHVTKVDNQLEIAAD